MGRIIILLCFYSITVKAQQISGTVNSKDYGLSFANVYLKGSSKGKVTDENGAYIIKNVEPGEYTIVASFTGYKPQEKKITISNADIVVNFTLQESDALNEIIISGTLKAVSRLESPVPVEVYSQAFFKKNPTPSIFEALQNVNGVRPQINCSVCNTGDIHINGLEGPYTLVLIDGMPIVSGLSTVYGLSGIPNSLIEQVEIVKGPASSLYGSEAVGGLINVITKLPENAPIVFADVNGTSWGEVNTDLGFKAKIGKTYTLLGANYFNYSNPIDNNNDNFTDVTLQDRVSIFNKWTFYRKENRQFSLAGRYFYEDRWGGEMQWNNGFRGGDVIYGESIYTSRYEFIGKYQLPINEKVDFQFSYSDHDQNSVYGNTPYLALQRIGFGQLIWDKKMKHNDLLFGLAARYNYYDDNTTVTNTADEVVIPSVFIQDEITLAEKHRLLIGGRYDYDERHGNIFTPRLAYRYKPSETDIIRLNTGTGFRVVNLFTEEHAALTGAREVEILNTLNPEQSFNVNLNYLKKIYSDKGQIYSIDASVWYTHFSNAIIPDYDTDPNKVIYDNLDGKSVSTGMSLNLDAVFAHGITASLGATYQDVSQTENGIKRRQMLTENFTGVWSFSYKHFPTHLKVDYTGNIYGPMRLPVLGDTDPRSDYSPIWSIQNIQLTYDGLTNFEIYGGVKNLLNWTPNKGIPFLISRANDPFDKTLNESDPSDLPFDPSYVYAPNQGIRAFIGLRYNLK